MPQNNQYDTNQQTLNTDNQIAALRDYIVNNVDLSDIESAEEKNKIISQLMDIVMERILTIVTSKMNEDQIKMLDSIIDTNDERAIIDYMVSVVPDTFNIASQVLRETIEEFNNTVASYK